MAFLESAAGLITDIVMSLATNSLGEKINNVRNHRRMTRLVEDAVDSILEQTEDYLRAEKLSDEKMVILVAAICRKLKPLTEDPQQFFSGNLDGARIFQQCHPDDELPQEIREEQLGQFYTVLFPRIAHFMAGSRIALREWQAEGYREGFKRLSQLADQIRNMSSKVTDLPEAVVDALADENERKAQSLLRDISQTLLNNLLLKMDISPLRAERVLYGTLNDHFVIPIFANQRKVTLVERLYEENVILSTMAEPGARRMLYGGAGIGKTTCCLWMQSRFLQSDPTRLAVVLRLREAPEIEKHSLLDIIRRQAGTHLRDALTDDILRKWHKSGRLVVILDGFDEVHEMRRDAVEKWINDLVVVADQTAVLVTSRPLQSGHLDKLEVPWQRWDVLPFDESRIIEFIERWHRYLPEGELSSAEREVDANSLAKTFSSDASLKNLADTPLMLGTLLFVHHRDKKLPSGRVDLYERYIGAMLGLRDSGLGIEARATRLTDKQKRRVLSDIGLHFHLEQVNQVNDDTMLHLVRNTLKSFKLDEDVEHLLTALCERTGLLQGPGSWSFMHKTIGEFLVAELICDGATRLPDKRRLDRKELWLHWKEDAWTAVLFFWAGKTTSRELEEFIKDLTNERSVEAGLLALSLLYDQGDRLNSETQRLLAHRLIAIFYPSAFKSHHKTFCGPPEGPVSEFNLIHEFNESLSVEDYKNPYYVNAVALRGLSICDSTRAFSRLFARGVLVPEDIRTFRDNCRNILTVSAFWAMSEPNSHVSLDIRYYVDHIPSNVVASFCYDYASIGKFKMGCVENVQTCREWLSEWLTAFPERRLWVPLLLANSLFRYILIKEKDWLLKSFCSLLWEWRNEPIDEDWLITSDEYQCGYLSVKDLLKEIKHLLAIHIRDDFEIPAEQHADLVAWCNRQISRRRELSLARKNRQTDIL